MAQTLMMPRILFTVSVARASPETSSAIMKRGAFVALTYQGITSGFNARTGLTNKHVLPFCQSISHSYLLQQRNNLANGLNLLVSDEHKCIIKLCQQLLLVGHKLRAQVATVNLHALLDFNKSFG
eukprot:364487-Chlamydomonas_euryale.AAC.21